MNLQIFILLSMFWTIKCSDDFVAFGNKNSHTSVEKRAANYDPPKITDFIVKTDVKNNYAETHVISKVENYDVISKQAVFSVVLPESAFLSSFFMEINNQTYKAFTLEKNEARNTYSKLSLSGQSAAHVTVSTRNAKRVSINMNLEPMSTVIFHLVYEELLQRNKGVYEVIANIQPGQIVKNLLVEVTVNESKPLLFVNTPLLRTGNVKIQNSTGLDPDAKIETVSDTTAIVTFRPDIRRQFEFGCSGLGNRKFDGFAGQFVVQYDVKREASTGSAFCDDDIVVVSIVPPELEPIPKHIVFVLDRSTSMHGTKLAQLKEAMEHILTRLNPDDLFDIVLFETSVYVRVANGQFVNVIPPSPHYGNLEGYFQTIGIADALPATAENIEFAKQIVKTITAEYGTNTLGALEAGLYLIKRVQEQYNDKYQPMLAFLTDGLPYDGITDKTQIAKLVRAINEREYKSPIYTVAIGDDADWNFLRELSLVAGGFPTRVHVDKIKYSDLSVQLQQFFDKISTPVLRNITFNLPPSVQTATNYFPVIFNGSEITVVGTGNSKLDCKDVSISAVGKDGPIVIIAKEGVPVARLKRVYAFTLVKQLTEKYYSTNSQTEKADISKQILKLALEHSLVTEFTSLVVASPNNTNSVVELEDAAKGIFPESPKDLPECKDVTGACLLKEDGGNCRTDVTKWTYSKTRGECKKFYYSGCGGNDNRFDSQEECSYVCETLVKRKACSIEEDYGTCHTDLPETKWAFSKRRGVCKKFYYSGCGGNDNRFNSKLECLQTCSDGNIVADGVPGQLF